MVNKTNYSILLLAIFIISACQNSDIVADLGNNYMIYYDSAIDKYSLSKNLENGNIVEVIPQNICEYTFNKKYILIRNKEIGILEAELYILINKENETVSSINLSELNSYIQDQGSSIKLGFKNICSKSSL